MAPPFHPYEIQNIPAANPAASVTLIIILISRSVQRRKLAAPTAPRRRSENHFPQADNIFRKPAIAKAAGSTYNKSRVTVE